MNNILLITKGLYPRQEKKEFKEVLTLTIYPENGNMVLMSNIIYFYLYASLFVTIHFPEC